jgi:UDP-N-acetyl-D-galactosamine dehydrogenase
VAELVSGHDRTNEVDSDALGSSTLKLTTSLEDCVGGDMYIVTVPTPVDSANRPDLGAVLAATRMIAGLIDPARRPTIVYESTVYPGATEDLCGPELERGGLVRGRYFRLGYSLERINPGDREHTIDKITKVIAREDAEVVEQLATVYGAVTSGGVFRAASTKAAEAAKARERAARHQHCLHQRGHADLLEGRPVGVGRACGGAHQVEFPRLRARPGRRPLHRR